MVPKVSVIVPVYNTERYLRKCLDSLVLQTLKDLEVIIVNDGSFDHSQNIIDEYVQKYPNKFTSIIKKHDGLGDARNHGLEVAKGEYVGFVDSDDLVDPYMYETLYNATLKGHDLIICDIMLFTDGEEDEHVSKGFRGNTFNKRQAIMYSTDPAFACNKLFKRKSFNKLKFLKSWYEDISTIPILTTYSESIHYVPTPLYYYRQRSDSYSNSQDKRTLGVISSWERVLNKAKPEYMDEAVFAVARSIAVFTEFKPHYADQFITFARKYQDIIEPNKYYQEFVKEKQIKDLFSFVYIPPKIHYCWFGNNEKPELIKRCIESWRQKLPNYEIIEWNETNCNLEENNYVREAYKAKKWAFVSDYFRLKALYEHGGIYLDTDTEITRNLDPFRDNKTFLAFESSDHVQVGILGCIQAAPFLQKLLKSYHTESFFNEDGTYNTKTIVVRVTDLLVNEYNLKLTGETQVLEDNIVIYPANILTLDVGDGENFAIQHYASSWWDVNDEPSWKETVLRRFLEENKKE